MNKAFWDAKTKLESSLVAAKLELSARMQEFLDKVDQMNA